MKRHLLSFVVAGLLVAALILYLVFYQVRFNQVVVLTTFEKITNVKDKPGPYLKWPRPIQRVHKFDKRLQIYQSPLVQLVPVGRETIIMSVGIGWRISDGRLFYREVYSKGRTTDYAKELLAGQVKTNLFVIENHPLSHLISANESELKYDEIEADMRKRLNEIFPGQYGITVDFVKVVRLAFTKNVTRDYLAEQSQVLQRIAQKRRIAAEQEAETILEKAKAERDRILVEARGRAETIKSEGDAQAAKYYGIFTEHSDLAIFLDKLKTLQEIRERTTIILDTLTPPYNLLQMDPRDLQLQIGKQPPEKK